MKSEVYRMWIVDTGADTTYAEGHIKDSDSLVKFSVTFDNDMLKRELSEDNFIKSQTIGHMFDLSNDKIEFLEFPELTEEQFKRAEDRANRWYDSLLESGAFSGK